MFRRHKVLYGWAEIGCCSVSCVGAVNSCSGHLTITRQFVNHQRNHSTSLVCFLLQLNCVTDLVYDDFWAILSRVSSASRYHFYQPTANSR